MVGSAVSFQFDFSSNSKKSYEKYEIEAPFGVPGTSRKEKPTLTGDGINTHTLDSYLSQCPDQPATEELKPQARDIYGQPSNSLLDWMRITRFVDHMDTIEMTYNAAEAQP